MKAFIAATLAASALATAVPAIAQPMGSWDLDRRIGWLQERIDRGIGDGSLDRREARRVQRELRSIKHAEDRRRARHGGRLWDNDRDALEARLDTLSDHIHWARDNPDFHHPW